MGSSIICFRVSSSVARWGSAWLDPMVSPMISRVAANFTALCQRLLFLSRTRGLVLLGPSRQVGFPQLGNIPAIKIGRQGED
jgi:hypothetical protein